MLCESVKVWFNDYLDGDLNSKKKEAVDIHLERCDHCRQEFNKLKQADDLLRLEVRRMFQEIPLPEGLQSKIDDKIKMRGSRIPFYERLQRGCTGIAAALLIFAAAYGMFHQQLGGHLFTNLKDGESLPEVTDQVNLPEVNDPAQINQFDKDGDVRTVITGKPVEQSGQGAQNQPENARQPAMIAELPARPPAGGADTYAGANPVASQKLESTVKKANGAENAADSAAAMTGAGKRVDNADSKNDLVPLTPSYLPKGTVLESLSRSENVVSINYTTGNLKFGIEERPATEANILKDKQLKGKEVKINGRSGTLLESVPAGQATIIFKQDSLLITIEGTLPVEEILKIAESLQ
ncbi:DUF4367 domain-containing protein [Pelotomaculum isophthalicicum JI]|uniref:Anti-sigma-W factor RsiW n=1 Tax=Pelotomaculum isophthalicicum JI TaxID=947010 RepID=A0A9X4JVT4_9FIRM|nr:DUF4367 domain-containing protein [Pelotomaculum isophthalicicum]MDF9407948.1 DUF4367 domain-containing protein [Pelotomaculum isophthalicicum JI]